MVLGAWLNKSLFVFTIFIKIGYFGSDFLLERGFDDTMEHEQSTGPTGQPTGQTNSVKNEIWEWIKALLIAAALVFVIRWFLFAPFIVDGPSMEPNFHSSERLIVNKFIYSLREPERGEVVVFHATPEKDYIKRVIGLPGETVKVEGDKVFVDGKQIEEHYLQGVLDEAAKSGKPYNLTNFPETKVPEGKIFVMGDNRSNSLDSRSSMVGFIEFDRIVGRADVVFWPLTKLHWVGHN